MNDHDASEPFPVAAWLFPAVIHGILGLTLFTSLLALVPRFARLFREFALLLPGLTEAVLVVSAWVNQYVAVAVLALMGATALDALVLWALGGWNRREGRAWFWAILVVLLLTCLLVGVSLFWPYYKLRRALEA